MHAKNHDGSLGKILRKNIYLLFPVTFISGMRDFMGHLTSGILCVRHIIEIWIHSADACPLAVSCVGYTCVAKNPFKPP